MTIDSTNSKMKEYLIQNQQPEKLKFFAETNDTLKQVAMELTETLDHPEVTLGISGGGLFSIASFEVVNYLLKQGVKINDIIGNSGGSLVGALVATHNVKKEYLDSIFSHMTLSMSKYLKIPSIVLGLMTPFLCEFTYKGEKIDIKEFLLHHTDKMLKELSHKKIFENGSVQEDVIKDVVANIIGENHLYPNDSKKEIFDNLAVHKLSFNDVKTEYGTDFKVMATVVKGTLDFKTLEGRKDLLKIAQFKKVSHDGKDVLQDITFTGSFPVIDSLLVSTFGLPQKISVKGKMIKALDGMVSWNDFPYTASHYAGHDKDKPIVLVHTPGITPPDEETKGIWPKELSYGKNQYVITPDLDGNIDNLQAHFDSKSIPLIRKVAKDIVEGTDNL